MKGNYQEEDPMMKLTPASSITINEYQVQQYTREDQEENKAMPATFQMVPNQETKDQ